MATLETTSTSDNNNQDPEFWTILKAPTKTKKQLDDASAFYCPYIPLMMSSGVVLDPATFELLDDERFIAEILAGL